MQQTLSGCLASMSKTQIKLYHSIIISIYLQSKARGYSTADSGADIETEEYQPKSSIYPVDEKT